MAPAPTVPNPTTTGPEPSDGRRQPPLRWASLEPALPRRRRSAPTVPPTVGSERQAPSDEYGTRRLPIRRASGADPNRARSRWLAVSSARRAKCCARGPSAPRRLPRSSLAVPIRRWMKAMSNNGLRLAKKAVHADPNYADGHLSVAMASQAASRYRHRPQPLPKVSRAGSRTATARSDVKAIPQGRYLAIESAQGLRLLFRGRGFVTRSSVDAQQASCEPRAAPAQCDDVVLAEAL